MKVMTFNLRVFVPQDGENAWPSRITEAVQAIAESEAAVVCTQEGLLPMLQDLDQRLPDYRWIGEGRRGGGDDEHCAVFYRPDLLVPVESGTFWLSEYPEQPGTVSWNSSLPRICTWVRLQGHDGREWGVFNTHLDHMSEEARTNGIRLIAERVDEMRSRCGIPVVVAGDFNSTPESEAVGILRQSGFTDAYAGFADGAGRTYHGFGGGDTGEPIDYIFVTPEAQVASCSVNRQTYNGRYPSDHYPVIATCAHAGE